MYVYMYLYVCMYGWYVFMYAFMYLCMYVCVYVCIGAMNDGTYIFMVVSYEHKMFVKLATGVNLIKLFFRDSRRSKIGFMFYSF